jgi:hypothetical protein
MNRITILICMWACASGCKREEIESARKTVEVAREAERDLGRPIAWFVDRANDERARHDAQLEQLERTVAEVQKAIDTGRLDEAEVKAVAISWAPITSPDNARDKALIDQFDRKRESFLAIIERRRKP